MNERYSINDVIDQFHDFLNETWPVDMEPSKCRKAFEELEELSNSSFEEINNMYSFYIEEEDCDFSWDDEEFENKLSNEINEHISYLEEQVSDYNTLDDMYY